MILYVALGGAMGAVLRYLSVVQIGRWLGVTFPYGTLCVNVLGSLCMGLIAGLFAKTLPHSMELRAFLVIGVLGGFTTFSAFSLDAMTLIEQGQWGQAAMYITASVVLSIFALFVGLMIIR